jgi:hypothetical protein
LPLTTSHADALAPHVELLHGGGAEGVASGEHDLLALALQLGRELADRGRLADAVDADDHHHRGLGREDDASAADAEDLRGVLAQGLPDALLVLELVLLEPLLDLGEELLRRLATPTSEVRSTSSICSTICGSISFLPVKSALRRPKKPSFSRTFVRPLRSPSMSRTIFDLRRLLRRFSDDEEVDHRRDDDDPDHDEVERFHDGVLQARLGTIWNVPRTSTCVAWRGHER